ncbi:exonuclease [Bacillus manliponensis]|uniref:Nuclease SbcCD subunit C n=1 Tax=Bacillus manliponensis TaxID=574376 RepID=A0A073K7D9_9BACI|nr:SMC family ATPase [Bacillus manliponensis]KEK18188.1 exonuclease [Bacillus manliponensis]
MRPIQLIMTAFGPYKQCETIRFDELGEHRIFAISGNTGAGKTTIFDAICYALYGEASGEERNDTNMLRSQFAEDDMYTSVELLFQLKEKTYCIKRQLGHRKQGNKTVTGHAIEFYEVIDDEHVPCVDRFHVTDVNKKVETLIGLTKHQFSQIVMLPQGEFRKLLTSETENKEEILRRIFKTDRYKLMRELLDQKRKEWKELLQGKLKERELYFRNAFQLPIRDGALLEGLSAQEYVNTHQVVEALQQELTFYEHVLSQLEEKQRVQLTQLKELETRYHAAKAINDRLEELEVKKKRYEELQSERSVIEEKEERFKRAEQASRLLPFEQWYEEAMQSVKEAEQVLENVRTKKEQTDVAYKEATKQYEEEKQKEAVREEKKRNVQELEELQPIIASLADKKLKLQQCEEQIINLKHNIQNLVAEQEKNNMQKQQLSMKLKELEAALAHYVTKLDQLSCMRDDAKVLKQAYDVWQEVQQYEKEKVVAEERKDAATVAYDTLEKQWLNEQAGQLALHLHDGESCPVCGSTSHPKKATEQGVSINEKELNELREQKIKAEKLHMQVEEKWNFYKVQYEQCRKEVVERGYHAENLQEAYALLIQTGKQLAAEVNELKQKEEERKQLLPQVQQLDEKLETIQKQKHEVENSLHRIEMEHVQLRTSFENDQQKIPNELQTMQAWKENYEIITSQLQHFELAWKQAQENYQRLMNENIRVEAEYEASMKQFAVASEKKEENYHRFIAALEQAGFIDQQSYKEAKLSEMEREQLQNHIQSYHSSLQALIKQVEELTEQLQGKVWADLTLLAEQVSNLEIELDIVKEKRQAAKGTMEYVVNLHENIRRIDEQIHEEESAFQELVDLYEVMKGDNESRISFERYILIEYLEQIVQVANERLRKLSNGQFYLKRSERVEKRNRQSGLGLDVYDAYTGQTRDVKTLSGGEKFNASLCLALGMADIIQSYEGGISIETMFIDEGFGSLDEESLTKAVDALIDLQKSGRFIGVISHVQELKNAMPAVLEVTKRKDGCSTTRFVVK